MDTKFNFNSQKLIMPWSSLTAYSSQQRLESVHAGSEFANRTSFPSFRCDYDSDEMDHGEPLAQKVIAINNHRKPKSKLSVDRMKLIALCKQQSRSQTPPTHALI